VKVSGTPPVEQIPKPKSTWPRSALALRYPLDWPEVTHAVPDAEPPPDEPDEPDEPDDVLRDGLGGAFGEPLDELGDGPGDCPARRAAPVAWSELAWHFDVRVSFPEAVQVCAFTP
jgi:hypothetical protein